MCDVGSFDAKGERKTIIKVRRKGLIGPKSCLLKGWCIAEPRSQYRLSGIVLFVYSGKKASSVVCWDD